MTQAQPTDHKPKHYETDKTESPENADKTPQLGYEGRRVVLLITTPLGESFKSICQAVGHPPPRNPPIDWSSFENSALPDLNSRLRFTTHYALCVIDCDDWDNNELSLLDKFQRARFWDHPGDMMRFAPSQSSTSDSSATAPNFNAGVRWSEENIVRIESGEEIGRTDMSDDEITRVYNQLRRDWTYMPVFWNCHDLAIRLAHIIIQRSMSKIRTLKSLIASLHQAYYREINWNDGAGRMCVGGWGVAAVGGLAAVPPLAAVGVGVFMAGWTVGFVGGFVEDAKLKLRRKFMTKLEELFPELASLHR